ncbi:cell division protein CrgA [Aquipuribacter sp. MA13-6]|uniref:cell division protein CrgA n=1 Tax=unclassified Aquipuribacter TaxID=2635084 RepID=UPI003EED63FB
MPESSRRKKPASPAPVTTGPPAPPKPNPRWWVPVMVGLMVLGLVWIVVFYITQQAYPIPGIGLWNLGVGFGLAMAGFLMTTRWR